MLALYRCGRQAEALRTYGQLRQVLREQLGIEPSLGLARLEEAILLQTPELDWQPTVHVRGSSMDYPSSPGRIDRRTSVATADTARPTKPFPVTTYVAADQVRAVQKLLGTTRLLTLTGTGGIGKTRLAMEVTTAVLDDYEDVRVVELAPVADPDLVAPQILIALGAAETPGESVQRALVDWVANRCVLMVLDNCEHLLEAAAVLVDRLLAACPNLRILATSRESLRLPAEIVWRVPPLSMPPQRPDQPLQELASFESVRLFLDRAMSVTPDLTLSERNAPALAAICRRLDGIPLALELAAARMSVLSLDELAERLDDRFRLLAHGFRSAPARHRTLRAAVDWSYEALPTIEQRVFDRSSVFAGSFDLEALERVTSGEGVDETEALEALAGLTDKSFVLHENADGRSRYRLLETLRQYGAEKLAAAGEQPRVRAAHLHWALSRAEQVNAELEGARGDQRSERFALDHDNFRSALGWAVSSSRGGEALRLCHAMSGFWYLQGHFSEARQWFEAALLSAPDVAADLRAKALHAAAGFALAQADYGAAEALDHQSLTCCEEVDDFRGKGQALGRLAHLALRQDRYEEGEALGHAALAIAETLDDTAMTAASLETVSIAARGQGDFERARRVGEQALDLRRKTGAQLEIGLSLRILARLALDSGDYGAVELHCQEAEAIARRLGASILLQGALWTRGASASFQGDFDSARKLLGESLDMAERCGDQHDAAWSRQLLADIATAEGDLALAQKEYDDVLAVAGRLNDRYMAEWSLRGLSRVAGAQGDGGTSAALAVRALVIAEEIGDRPGSAGALEILAGLAARRRHATRAAQLLGAARRLRLETSAPLPALQRREYDRTVSLTRAALGPGPFEREFAAGGAMGDADRVAVAAEDMDAGR